MNRIPTRSGCFTPGHLRLKGLILALALGLTTLPLPSMANMSNATNGRIHGRAPDVTGTPVILMPDGTTPVTNNAQVLWSAKTADFTLAPVSSYVTYVDADGDAPQGVGYTTPASGGVTWVWATSGGTLLNSTQLSQPFQNNFADGTVLKVTVSQAVDVASISGMPNARQRTLHSGTFDVVVKKPLVPPKVFVSDTMFDGDSGFPTTGFPNASFQFYMNGTNANTNGNYTYSSNQSWVTVTNGTTNTAGTVTFTGTPTSADNTVVITVTDKSGISPAMTYSFTLKRWLVLMDYVSRTAIQSDALCASLGGGYETPDINVMTMGDMTRMPIGPAWSEWGQTAVGNLGGGAGSRHLWSSTPAPAAGMRQRVMNRTGRIRNAGDGQVVTDTLTACSRPL